MLERLAWTLHDEGYDVAIVTEALVLLCADACRATLKELDRVSRRCILIMVSNDENLKGMRIQFC